MSNEIDLDEYVEARFKCNHPNCSKQPTDVTKRIKKYQVGLMAIWFHSFHEGHKFSYWENGELILGDG